MGDTREESVLALTGRLDGRSCADVREALHDHIERHPDEDIVIDVHGVESIDANVLRTLAASALRLERARRHLVLRGCSPAVRRLVTFAGCRRLFRIERP